MDVIVIESKAFELLKKEIKDAVKDALKEVLEAKEMDDKSDYITGVQAQEYLPLRSKSSWQKLRNSGKIEFTQFGRKIMYSRKSILKYLDEHRTNFYVGKKKLS